MLGNDDFLEFALRWWPPLAATQVFEWLGDGDFLARVADGILSQHEQATLVKSWDGALSIEDIPLLDELRYALDDVPEKHGPQNDFTAHHVADLQELSPSAPPEFATVPRWRQPPNT